MFQNVQIRKLKCDNPECNKEIEFLLEESVVRDTYANPANSWLLSGRVVGTGDGRQLFYCSDICEILGAKSGSHNRPDPKKIIEDANPAAVKAAVAAAEAKAASDKNLKEGGGGPILVKG
jgi:hypothetical protein